MRSLAGSMRCRTCSEPSRLSWRTTIASSQWRTPLSASKRSFARNSGDCARRRSSSAGSPRAPSGRLSICARRRSRSRPRAIASRPSRSRPEGEACSNLNNALPGRPARARPLLAGRKHHEVRRSLRMIEQVALEGAWVVRRFQDFSRSRPARPFQPVDLNQLVDEIAASARSRWTQQLAARGINGEVHSEPGPVPLVPGDMAQLRQVLTAIALNALDAMPEGGNLTFRTGTEGGRVYCQIADTGIGMTEQVRLHIFDPFFTTKREKGKGFGLSGAYAIVDRHGGEMKVESEPGKGTVFTVWLPSGAETSATRPDMARQAANPPAPEPPPAPKSAPGAKILAVDDSEEDRE